MKKEYEKIFFHLKQEAAALLWSFGVMRVDLVWKLLCSVLTFGADKLLDLGHLRG